MSPKPRFEHVIVSPHLDDAVFSCGGLLSTWTARGERPLVLNVFSQTSLVASETEVRLAEERAAAAMLGYESRVLGAVDAFVRDPAYSSMTGLFDTAPSVYIPEVDHVIARLRAALDTVEYGLVLAPLGIGWHVDHLLAHLAACAVVPKERLSFYEDMPYVFVPQLLAYRLHELERSHRPPAGSVLAHALAASAFYAGTASMKQAVSPGRRALAMPVLAAWFARQLVRHRHKHPDARALTPVVHDVSPHADRRLDACELYASQFPRFFDSRAQCSAWFSAHARRLGSSAHAVERTWRPVP